MTATLDLATKIYIEIRAGIECLDLEEHEASFLRVWNESELVEHLVHRLGRTKPEVFGLLKTVQDQTQNERDFHA